MKIAVAREIDPTEPRVAASPDTVKKFRAIGAEVAIEPGAGIKSPVMANIRTTLVHSAPLMLLWF